jgi:hyperosmotically inducible protein
MPRLTYGGLEGRGKMAASNRHSEGNEMKRWTNGMHPRAALLPAPAGFAAARMPHVATKKAERHAPQKPVMLPSYNVFDTFSARVEGHWVTLIGKVTHPATKTDAEAALRRMVGTTAVKNLIEVLPWSPDDDRLRKSLYRAVYGHPSIEPLATLAVPPIRLIVENGHVTLEGAVSDGAAKSAAEQQANRVFGVFSVTNRLLVESET